MWRVIRQQYLIRVWHELAGPSTLPRRIFAGLVKAIAAFIEYVLKVMFLPINVFLEPTKKLYVIYDTTLEPFTYDLTWTLAAIELERKRANICDIHMVFIVPKKWYAYTESHEYNRMMKAENISWRFYNILLPLCQLLPSIKNISVFSSPYVARVFLALTAFRKYPKNSLSLFPHKLNARKDIFAAKDMMPCLTAPSKAVFFSSQWLEKNAAGRKVITMTFRQYGYGAARNSNEDAWAQLTHDLDAEEYFVVLLPDTDQVLTFDDSNFANAKVFEVACFDVRIRMALYEAAWMNMGVNTGPMALCYFGKTSLVQVKKITESTSQSRSELITQHGFEIEKQPVFFSYQQKIHWNYDDSYEELCTVFLETEKSYTISKK